MSSQHLGHRADPHRADTHLDAAEPRHSGRRLAAATAVMLALAACSGGPSSGGPRGPDAAPSSATAASPSQPRWWIALTPGQVTTKGHLASFDLAVTGNRPAMSVDGVKLTGDDALDYTDYSIDYGDGQKEPNELTDTASCDRSDPADAPINDTWPITHEYPRAGKYVITVTAVILCSPSPVTSTRSIPVTVA